MADVDVYIWKPDNTIGLQIQAEAGLEVRLTLEEATDLRDSLNTLIEVLEAK